MLVRIRSEIYGAANLGVVIEDERTGRIYDPTANSNTGAWMAPDAVPLSDAMVNRVAVRLFSGQPTKGRWGVTLTIVDDSSAGLDWLLMPFDLRVDAPGMPPSTPPVPLAGMTMFYNGGYPLAVIAASRV